MWKPVIVLSKKSCSHKIVWAVRYTVVFGFIFHFLPYPFLLLCDNIEPFLWPNIHILLQQNTGTVVVVIRQELFYNINEFQ